MPKNDMQYGRDKMATKSEMLLNIGLKFFLEKYEYKHS